MSANNRFAAGTAGCRKPATLLSYDPGKVGNLIPYLRTVIGAVCVVNGIQACLLWAKIRAKAD